MFLYIQSKLPRFCVQLKHLRKKSFFHLENNLFRKVTTREKKDKF